MPPEANEPQPAGAAGDPRADRLELAALATGLARLAARAQAGGQRAPARRTPAGGVRAGSGGSSQAESAPLPAPAAAGRGAEPRAARPPAAADRPPHQAERAPAQARPQAEAAAGQGDPPARAGAAAPGASRASPSPAPASSTTPAQTTPSPAPGAAPGAPPAGKSAAPAPPRPPAAAAPAAAAAADSSPGTKQTLAQPAGPAAQAVDPARDAPRAADLESLRALVAGCTACGLCRTRSRTVFADGPPQARLMFVGEAPGAREDQSGVPFVGDAGQLLTRIIEAGIGLRREQVYIANGIKCRPPDNRDPSPEEKRSCLPFLERQIELVDPLVLIALGRHAANLLLGTDLPISALRGRVHERGRRFVVPTFHPAYLLRNPEAKKDCWADVQRAMQLLGIAPRPSRGSDSTGG